MGNIEYFKYSVTYMMASIYNFTTVCRMKLYDKNKKWRIRKWKLWWH